MPDWFISDDYHCGLWKKCYQDICQDIGVPPRNNGTPRDQKEFSLFYCAQATSVVSDLFLAISITSALAFGLIARKLIVVRKAALVSLFLCVLFGLVSVSCFSAINWFSSTLIIISKSSSYGYAFYLMWFGLTFIFFAALLAARTPRQVAVGRSPDTGQIPEQAKSPGLELNPEPVKTPGPGLNPELGKSPGPGEDPELGNSPDPEVSPTNDSKDKTKPADDDDDVKNEIKDCMLTC